MADDQLPAKRTRRGGPYAVGARLAKVLTLLASGTAKNQAEACAMAGYTTRALQFALKKASVRVFMQEQVVMSLGLTAMKAAKRVDELLHSPNEMTALGASKFALATGLQIMPPDQRVSPLVAINIQNPGYVIDLSRAGDPQPPSNVLPFPLGAGEAKDVTLASLERRDDGALKPADPIRPAQVPPPTDPARRAPVWTGGRPPVIDGE